MTQCPAYQVACWQLQQGDRQGAIESLRRVLLSEPAAGHLWELLGAIHYSEREIGPAQDALEQATSLKSLSRQAQLVLADCYRMSGYVESARSILRHLASSDVWIQTELLESLASCLGGINECELALAVCREAARRSPDSPEPYMGMAHYMLRLARPKEQVLAVLWHAFRLDPSDFSCRICLAWQLHENGQSAEAAELFEVVSIDDCRCTRCLRRMQCIFEAAAAYGEAARCESQIRLLNCEANEGKRPS